MKFISASATFIALSFMVSCGGKDKKTEEPATTETKTEAPADSGSPTKLEGAWVIKRAGGAMDSLNIGTVYTFKGNKLSFGKEGYTNPGRTEVTDSTFSFQAEGNELKFMYNYKFNGDTLVVEMQNSGGQIFHMVKQ